jgi:predicted enzyme related to lactoylglutathione lyase
MTSRVEGVTFDASNPLLIARFWAAALGWNLDERAVLSQDGDDPESAGLVDPGGRALPFGFVRVPEPKTAKNRMHFDLGADGDMETEIARLVGLGARTLESHGEGGYTWTVMQDPEGNEFCLGAPEQGAE